MINKIIVQNNLRVGKFIGLKLEYDEDLLLNNDIKVKNFINKYSTYLNSCEEEDMLAFFKLTGLLICHEYVEKDSFKRIYFSLNGPYSYDYEELKNKPNAYNNHLIIETHVNNLKIWKSSITANKDTIYQLKNKAEIDVNKHKWNLSTMNIKERIDYLKKNSYLLPNKKDIKDILVDPFNNILSLTDSGYLYINDYLYANDVNYMFELNSTDIKFIYKNNVIEDYSNHFNGLISKQYDKVLYDDNFIAMLENGELIIFLILELNYDKSMYFRFIDVDDIAYKKNDDTLMNQFLIIKKNCEEIKLPLKSIMLMS